MLVSWTTCSNRATTNLPYAMPDFKIRGYAGLQNTRLQNSSEAEEVRIVLYSILHVDSSTHSVFSSENFGKLFSPKFSAVLRVNPPSSRPLRGLTPPSSISAVLQWSLTTWSNSHPTKTRDKKNPLNLGKRYAKKAAGAVLVLGSPAPHQQWSNGLHGGVVTVSCGMVSETPDGGRYFRCVAGHDAQRQNGYARDILAQPRAHTGGSSAV